MKYIRTKDGIYKVVLVSPLGFVRIDKRDGTYPDVFEKDILKEADTIEELCDKFVAVDIGLFGDHYKEYFSLDQAEEDKSFLYDRLYGAIYIGKELIHVAKKNSKGEFELL
jgi:hypothetical protein